MKQSEMAKKDKRLNFYVNVLWDDEAKVFVSESNIRGLHVVADTIEEFQEVVEDVAFDLILSNHIDTEKLDASTIRESMPGIVFRIPEQGPARTVSA